MFKSIVVTYQKCSMPLKMYGFFGMGYRFLFKHLLSPWKLVISLRSLNSF